jgi:hypothetical protein
MARLVSTKERLEQMTNTICGITRLILNMNEQACSKSNSKGSMNMVLISSARKDSIPSGKVSATWTNETALKPLRIEAISFVDLLGPTTIIRSSGWGMSLRESDILSSYPSWL